MALGGALLAVPCLPFAQQQGKVWRVGFLSLRRVAILDSDYYYGPFRAAMRDLGYIEGKNLLIEWRSADGESGRLPGLAAELVNLHVDIIVTAATAATVAAQKATTTLPIVMGIVADPVGSGLVKSLAHPDGNITGLSSIAGDLSPKLLEMLRSMIPKLSRVAVLVNPHNPAHTIALKNVQVAAQRIGVTILQADAQTPTEIGNALAMIAREKVGALIISRDEFFNQQVRQIAELAEKNRLPTIAGLREYVEAGGLMSYGSSVSDIFRRTATYVDKIFKGAKPGEIPVEQPTKFELFINGRTAKTLGLKIPQSLLIMADKVIA
jgi:putative ABC transport system substrate-binding protein